MKILYLSCHESLEHDEIKLFHEMGHQVFSPGSYVNPDNRGDSCLRPDLPQLNYDPAIVEQYHQIGARFPGEDGKIHLTKAFVDNFDVVIVMHIPDWIKVNWEAIKHKPVIWRTIGQSVASTEQGLAPYRAAGLKIVRYSPQENFIPHYLGCDALIRFYKDPDEYGPWNGDQNFVISLAQSMQQRGSFCNYHTFEEATRPFPRKLFGPGNEQSGLGYGKIPFEQIKQEFRNNRVYFYTGTHPASYTLNFIESWISGIPIVAIGPKFGNADVWRNHNLYEIHNLIHNGVDGFISDSISQLQSHIRSLLNDKRLAQQISDAGRKEAIRHFGRDMIKASWEVYLGSL